MRYFRAYSFLFQSPNWATNLLFLSLCLLIPILGQIVMAGYLFQVLEQMHRRGRDDEVPNFDFSHFLEYLLRGIWPFLADFVLGLVFTVPYLIGYVGILLLWVGVDQQVVSQELAIAVTIVAAAVILILLFLMVILRYPIVLRCGLQQDFAPGFSFRYVSNFMGLVGGKVLLSLLFLMVSGLVVLSAGLMLCCVGILPATALITAAQYHLFYQLYELYLQRGGEPIPLKPTTPQPFQPSEEIVEDPRTYPE